LKALAVTGSERSALFPGIPTVAESGLPGFESGSMVGILAPAKTPEAIIKRLNQEIVRLLNTPEVKERFFNNGTEAKGSTPEEFAAKIKSEMSRLGKVIKDVGIRA
jgi:tripartite-type tricarboxylate transporter receptor subunit TctC